MRCLLAVLTGLLVALSHPPIDLGDVAWIALLPLLLAIDGQTWVRRCLLGFVAGMVASWGVVGYWLVAAFRQVPFDLLTATLLTQLGLTVCGVSGFVAFAYLCGGWRTARLPVVWVPATWVAIEYGRADLPAGGAWCLLGHSQYARPAVIQIADLTGVYGVSFLLCMSSVALASWWRPASRRHVNRAVAAALILVSLAYGAVRLRQSDASTDTITVQAVHPAWPHGLGEAAAQRLADLIHITAQAPVDRTALLVWPENALRFDLQDDGELSDRFTSFVQARQQYVIAGLHRHQREQGSTRYYNSAVLVAAEGSVIGVADKRMLVPVAESRWPLLPSVELPFSAGKPWVPLSAGQRRIGVLMCFESIFAEPARLLVRQGATLLINPTNDEILGAGAGQLAAMAVFRSVENGVPLVHVGTVGVTEILDAHGRLVALEDRRPRVLTASVSARRGGTWYTSLGDGFALACSALALAAAAWRRRAASRRDRESARRLMQDNRCHPSTSEPP